MGENMTHETWDQMTARHERERRDMVERLAAERITQTQAARRLGISLSGLNNFIQRNGIFWPVIRQGFRS
jgi:transcriptional regulator with GAF, ATPase, and Fis domain